MEHIHDLLSVNMVEMSVCSCFLRSIHPDRLRQIITVLENDLMVRYDGCQLVNCSFVSFLPKLKDDLADDFTVAPNYGTLFQMKLKLLNDLQILRQK